MAQVRLSSGFDILNLQPRQKRFFEKNLEMINAVERVLGTIVPDMSCSLTHSSDVYYEVEFWLRNRPMCTVRQYREEVFVFFDSDGRSSRLPVDFTVEMLMKDFKDELIRLLQKRKQGFTTRGNTCDLLIDLLQVQTS